MPIFRYRCEACGASQEHFQRGSEPDPQTCSCGGRLAKMMSSPAFHLKGLRWSRDGYARPKPEHMTLKPEPFAPVPATPPKK